MPGGLDWALLGVHYRKLPSEAQDVELLAIRGNQQVFGWDVVVNKDTRQLSIIDRLKGSQYIYVRMRSPDATSCLLQGAHWGGELPLQRRLYYFAWPRPFSREEEAVIETELNAY